MLYVTFIALAVAFTSNLLVTLSTNIQNFSNPVPLLLGVFVLGVALIGLSAGFGYLVQHRIPRHARTIQMLLLGLALALLIQSSFLSLGLRQLDGRDDITVTAAMQLTDVFLWTLLPMGFVLLALNFGPRLDRPTQAVSLFIVIFSFSSVATVAPAIYDAVLQERESSSIEKPKIFDFHKSQNKIIFVLDTLQGDVFDEVRDKYPVEVGFLQGFEFYPDSVAGYPTTRHAVTEILSGSYYRNEEPWSDAIFELNKDSLPVQLSESGYDVIGDFMRGTYPLGDKSGLSPSTDIRGEARIESESSFFRQFALLTDLALLRAAPATLKSSIYQNGAWLLLQNFRSTEFVNALQREDQVLARNLIRDSTLKSESPTFKYLHLIGAHDPIVLAPDFTIAEIPRTGRDGNVDQARASLRLLGEMLDHIKSLGIYETAEILVLSDHGFHNIVPNDVIISGGEIGFDPKILGQARPLVLFKPAYSSGNLVINQQPMQLGWAGCLMGRLTACELFELALSGNDVERVHLSYVWEHAAWGENFSPPMVEYNISGDSRETSNWRKSGRVYSSGTLVNIFSVILGEEIMLGKSDLERLKNFGWSGTEDSHTWTDSTRAGLSFIFDESWPQTDIDLSIRASALIPPGSQAQDVGVSLNGEFLETIPVSDLNTYSVNLPFAYLMQGRNDIELVISQPVRPCDISDSTDCRTLGIAVRSVKFSPAG